MRIAISPDRCAKWDRGSRTINLFTLTPYEGSRSLWWGPRWVNDDVISFGYEIPDRRNVTQIKMMDALISRLTDEAMDRHPAGSDTVSQINVYCPTCGGRGDTGPRYSPDTCQSCRGTGVVPRCPCVCHSIDGHAEPICDCRPANGAGPCRMEV